MDIGTQNDLRQLLAARLGELRAALNDAESLPGAEGRPGAHEVSDRKDEAALNERDTVEQAEEARDRAELSAVQAALDRLDRGVYGDCADCGEPIATQRLKVQPAAPRCAACQSAFEQRHARELRT